MILFIWSSQRMFLYVFCVLLSSVQLDEFGIDQAPIPRAWWKVIAAYHRVYD